MTDVQVVERKLAVILAADVAEYSRLMGLDEVGTLRTLQAYRAILDRLIAAHRGRMRRRSPRGDRERERESPRR